jgi:hypothetical protein
MVQGTTQHIGDILMEHQRKHQATVLQGDPGNSYRQGFLFQGDRFEIGSND